MTTFLVIPAWGKLHREFLCNYSLPSALSEGNIPWLAQQHPVTVLLYSKADDITWIKNHPTYAALSQVATVTFIDITTYEFIDIVDPTTSNNDLITKKMSMQSRVYRDAIQRADQCDEAYCSFLTADNIYSTNFFAHCWKRLQEGYDAMGVRAPRTSMEGICRAIDKDGGRAPSIHITPEKLARYFMDNMHKLSLTMFMDSDHYTVYPGHFIWAVGSKNKPQGIVIYNLHPHPVFVRHKKGVVDFKWAIDHDYVFQVARSPEHVYQLENSADGWVVECSPDNYEYEYKPRQAKISEICYWLYHSIPRYNLTRLAQQPILIHDQPIDTRWDATLAEARVVMTEVYNTLEGFWRKQEEALAKVQAEGDLL